MNNNLKQKNGKLPKWAIFVIIGTAILNIIVVGLFIALIIMDEGYDILNDDISKDLAVKEGVSTYLDDESYSYVVTGYVTNKGDVPHYDVEIEYHLYDEKGNIIGEATDYVEEIGVGKTWKFSAEYYGIDYKEVKRIELNELEGY